MPLLQLAPVLSDRDDRPHDDDGTGLEPIVALHQRVQNFDLSQREQQHDEEAAFQAVLHAGSVLTGTFPDTLDTVVQAMSWTGNPPVPDRQLMASAVTCRRTDLDPQSRTFLRPQLSGHVRLALDGLEAVLEPVAGAIDRDDFAVVQ
ncbi:hypothetical protein ACWD4T_33735 [Streptomyces umbrinus]